jgi:DUF4097 and DUF4098 domain-containing protein YvlB
MRRTTVHAVAAAAMIATAAPARAQGPGSANGPDIAIAIQSQIRAAMREAQSVKIKEVARAYQGRNQGAEQNERFSRKVRVGRDGRVSVSNISGDIVVNPGSGDEVSIDAVKRGRGQADLAAVRIVVDERPGRVDVRTEHPRGFGDRRGDSVSVDYTITLPAGAAIDVHSVSGNLKVTGARGAVRVETVSGDVRVSDTPKLEGAKSVSGNVTISGVSTEGDLAAGSVSGDLVANAVKVHGLELTSVSGNITATDVTCDRFTAKSVSGDVRYEGGVTRGGAYEVNVHSGDIRLVLANPAGFVFNANSFSGSIRSDLPMTIGGDQDRDRDRDRRGRRDSMSNRSMRATFGDGSATISAHSFSGDITLSKR